MAKQDDYARYTIRIPAELYERLKEAAGDKSVNAEIIARLEASFRPSLQLSTDKDLNDIIRRVVDQVFSQTRGRWDDSDR